MEADTLLRREIKGRGGAAGVTPTGVMRRQTLSDITNTVRHGGVENEKTVPCAGGAINYVEIMKENTALLKILAEKNKIIELSSVELQKVRLMMQKVNQQNWQLAQANSQMLAELNLVKDRLKNMQHELKCSEAMVKQKTLELEEKDRLIKQLSKKISAEEKSKCDDKATDVAPDVPILPATKKAKKEICNSRLGKRTTDTHFNSHVTTATTVYQDALDEARVHKKKSISSSTLTKLKTEECKSVKILLNTENPDKSLDGVDRRKSLRRRSTRLNPDLFESIKDTEESINTEILPLPIKEEETICAVHSLPLTGLDHANELLKREKESESGGSVSSVTRESVRRRSSVGRPSRRVAEKVVSYKERPLNIKMRRED